VTVRRLVPAGRDRVDTLGKAFDIVGSTTEIADNGPFFEHDLKVGSKSRTVRAHRGFRPIVVLEPPTRDLGTQSAYIHLDGPDLVIEGIDLVIDLSSLDPRHHKETAVFLVRAGELTLRDC
jgi:hypothetical protein